ncbi:hypothetical protein [Clostridium hydrogeniformans]|uniref:hypothetical protein n=1 Tax=Clostridium hydrogeniformans TaxID=349933 RepID=UPI0004844A09|nr:hypothetical protein [Clostridium hydrogeniformans]
MKKNKNRIWIIGGGIFIAVILFLIFGTSSYRAMKIKNIDTTMVEENLKSISEKDKEIKISDFTDFQWDSAYVFPSYYSQEEIYEKVGVQWTEAKTFLGYLFSRDIENGVLNENQYRMIFKRGDKIISSKVYDLKEVPVSFKLPNYEFTYESCKFQITTNEEGYKELTLKDYN